MPSDHESDLIPVRVSADPDLLHVISPPGRAFWSMEATLQLAQTVAILIGGLWAYHTYVTFQRRSNELALKAAEAQQRQAEVGYELAQLDVRKSQVELDRTVQSPLAITDRITVEPLSAGEYLARYDYSLTNSGNRPIRVTSAIADVLIAHPRPAANGAVLINDVGDSGPLEWQQVSIQGFQIADEWKSGVDLVNAGDTVTPQQGGGGTGTLATGESTQAAIAAVVSGQPTDLVGFRVRVVVQNSEGKSIQRRLREYAPLGSTRTGTREGNSR